MGMRHYYALYCPYGTSTLSGRDTLYRYDGAKKRNEDLVRVNRQWDESDPHMEGISAAQARHWFPEAFKKDAPEWNNWEQGDRHFDKSFWRVMPDGDEWTGGPRYR